MAQKVTWTPDPPQISQSHPEHRHFMRGDHVRVMRFANGREAKLSIFVDGRSKNRAQITVELDSMECEQLAGALLDAAHDIRTIKATAKVAA